MSPLAEIPVLNPADPTEIVGYAPAGTREDALAAVTAADGARRAWAALPVSERVELVGKLADASLSGLEERAALLTAENGKPLYEAQIEIGLTPHLCSSATRCAPEVLSEVRLGDRSTSIVVSRKPVGVVAAIIPFNWPIAVMVMKLAPALVAGNTVVVKPPLQCPLALIETIREMTSVLPPGVLNAVVGPDDEVAQTLVQAPQVRKISLTGSARTAVSVLHGVPDVKRFTFELGGNDPGIFLDDVHLDAEVARRVATGVLTTSGQVCFAMKRAYVHRSRYDELVGLLTAAFDEQVVGDGRRDGVTIGPLIDEKSRDRVRRLLADASDAGAEVRELGRIDDPSTFARGHFVRPTLVLGADQASGIVQEEQFAPVLPVLAFDDDEEVVRLANDTPFGLSSSVWSADEERACALGDALEAGQTFINSHDFMSVDIRAPFGGVKQSGIGRELGAEGLEAYTEQHAVVRKVAG